MPSQTDNEEEIVKSVIAADLKVLMPAQLIADMAGSQCFVISDANSKDQPIVYASPAFLTLTGYEKEEVLGRNCRFLQGPGTDMQEINQIGKALAESRTVTTRLRNYRKDQTTFLNDLMIAPLKNTEGELAYYIGIQHPVEQEHDAPPAYFTRSNERKDNAAGMEALKKDNFGGPGNHTNGSFHSSGGDEGHTSKTQHGESGKGIDSSTQSSSRNHHCGHESGASSDDNNTAKINKNGHSSGSDHTIDIDRDRDAPPLNPMSVRSSVNITFNIHDYTVQTQQGEDQRILEEVTGIAKQGEILVIMGPSGCGKTTLLNILAGRNTNPVSGEVRFNNSLRSRGVKRCIGYVVQDDIFFCNLTVRETLTVSAMLKLPDTMSEGEKTEQVNHTLRSLGIEHCADTIIGGPFNRGISGGERKRVNIGTQLVHYPSILLLDEPTSGLDSTTSLNLMMTLRQLANGGRTIITTLHQPSSQMFMLFNSLLVMSRGRVMYHGSRPHVLGYFGSLGYKCRPNYNPADFLLELASKKQEVCTELAEAFVQHADSEQYGRSKIVYRRLANAWSRKHTRAQADTASSSLHAPSASASSSSSVALTEVGLRLDARSEPDDKDNGEGECKHNKTLNEPTTRTAVANNEHAYDKDRDDEGTGEKEQVQEQEQVEFATDVDMPTSWWTQFKVLCKRSYTQKKGSYITPISIIELTFLTVFTSLIWFQISDDESSIEDRLGVLFFSDVYWAFNLVNAALGAFPAERPVINQERASGTYRLSAYFLGKTVSEMPLYIAYPAIYSTVMYFTVGLRLSFGAFVSYLLVLLLSVEASYSLGLLISTISLDFRTTLVSANLIIVMSMLIGGFFVNEENIPVFITWCKYLSFIRYAYEAHVLLEFSDSSTFTCAIDSEYAVCDGTPGAVITGKDITEEQGIESSIGGNIAVLVSLILLFRLGGYYCLRFLHRPRKPTLVGGMKQE